MRPKKGAHLVGIRKIAVTVLANLILAVVLFLLIEGSSSVILVTKDALSRDLPLNRRHSRFDEEIGWVNLPNVAVEDMFGPGKFFKTNSMGFRNDKEFSFVVPDNKVRLICSGDSFTMGHGVGNDHAWCKLLESIDGRIESVNLGHAGYGIDQSYLWYKRNMAKLEYDVHVFAFITEDFRRMQSPTFVGRGKPLLVLENDVLVDKSRPIPEPSSKPGLNTLRGAAADLRSVEILRKVISRTNSSPALALEADVRGLMQAQKVAARIFEDLREGSKDTNSTLVLVYLPTRLDFIGMDSELWRRFLRDEASKHGLIFVDLIDDFRRSPLDEVKNMFDETHNHYTETGNLYITSLLYKRLLAIPEVEQKFRQRLAAAR